MTNFGAVTEIIEAFEEYEEWKALRKQQALDLSPQTFFAEKARSTALDRLEKVAAWAELNDGTQPPDFTTLYGILDGDE